MVKDDIHSESSIDESIRISGSNFVWTEYDDYNNVYSLFIYNGSTVTKLSGDIVYYYDEETYFISGSNVIWTEANDEEEYDYSESLFFYNGSTITKLSDHFSSYYDYGSSPISGSTVIWFESEEDDEGDWIESLYAFNGSTKTKLSSSSEIFSIRISGSNIIWKEWDSYNEVYALFIYNGSV